MIFEFKFLSACDPLKNRFMAMLMLMTLQTGSLQCVEKYHSYFAKIWQKMKKSLILTCHKSISLQHYLLPKPKILFSDTQWSVSSLFHQIYSLAKWKILTSGMLLRWVCVGGFKARTTAQWSKIGKILQKGIAEQVPKLCNFIARSIQQLNY